VVRDPEPATQVPLAQMVRVLRAGLTTAATALVLVLVLVLA
jgi:hypothetical protein